MTDTHDTNLPEKPVELEEEKKAAEVSEPATTETPAEEIVSEKPVEPVQKLTKEEILAKLKEVVADVENVAKPEIDGLKQFFYKLHNAEQEAARKLFIENGGAAENFVPQTDSVEEEFKNIMSVIKEKRSALTAELEKQKEMNLQVKLSIIEELKELVESPDDANKSYTEFKKLQQQWNEVKLVPQAKVNELWKNYQLYVEKFYDLLKLNNEFREYDFKKNLEIKTHLCEAAEKLADEADVVSAFHQLQKLHQEFRENKTISRAQVQNILKNPFYIGYFINKGKTYKHNYPRLIDEELFRIVQDTMEGRKRAPSKLYYGDKQYIFTGLVRCGCCGSLMTCETKVKDENHSYNYLKCNKLRSKCSQKPVNEAKILAQLENELCLPMDINDDMLKNIKSEVKKRLKEENINTANLKRDITIKLHDLDEQIKTLFRGYIQGKCDEKMYNELKTEIELEKEKLQKDMDRYLEIDTETDETLVNIAEIAANVGKFLKSPIISQKRDILNLILSDCKTERKNLCFSITKPFDKLLKTPEINKWCR